MTGSRSAAFARSKIGQGYIYGARGQTCTAAFRRQQAKQYPAQAQNILVTGAKWDGLPVWDCAQLTRYAAKAAGVELPSGATSQWRKARWKRKGTIETIPENEVVYLYKQKGAIMQHTGIALGDGTCVHARGTAYGVVHQPVRDYPWTHWASPFETNEKNKISNDSKNNKGKIDIKNEDKKMMKVFAENGKPVKLRKTASESENFYYKVNSGEKVVIIKEEENWSFISAKCTDGEVHQGYMMKKFLI